MIRPIKAGESMGNFCVDRVINIHWGSRSASRTFDCIEYECLFRLNDGSWYINDQCDGPNGGNMTTRLSAVDDSNVETYAKELKDKWQKTTG